MCVLVRDYRVVAIRFLKAGPVIDKVRDCACSKGFIGGHYSLATGDIIARLL